VTEETPFGPDVLVYKVAGKMFVALVSELIERSYELVIKGMTKAQSELLKDAS
jgi:predicted DNA-binding protein (MmcQ/YjbR family)